MGASEIPTVKNEVRLVAGNRVLLLDLAVGEDTRVNSVYGSVSRYAFCMRMGGGTK